MRNSEKNQATESFSAELFRLRTTRGRTQLEVARAAAIARSYYSELENERRRPPKDNILERIIDALDLSTAECLLLRELAKSDRGKASRHIHLHDIQTLLQFISTATTLPDEKIQRIQAILEEK